MRKSSIGIVCALALGLFGCQWFPGTGTENPDVQKVIDLAKQVCSFEPTVQSVAAMLAAANPQVTGVANIAHAICEQVNKATASGDESGDTKATPKGGCSLGEVNGVCVEGKKLDNAKSATKEGDCPLGSVNGVCVQGKKSE